MCFELFKTFSGSWSNWPVLFFLCNNSDRYIYWQWWYFCCDFQKQSPAVLSLNFLDLLVPPALCSVSLWFYNLWKVNDPAARVLQAWRSWNQPWPTDSYWQRRDSKWIHYINVLLASPPAKKSTWINKCIKINTRCWPWCKMNK